MTVTKHFFATTDAAKLVGISVRQFFKEVKKHAIEPMILRKGSLRVARWTNAQIEKLKQLRTA